MSPSWWFFESNKAIFQKFGILKYDLILKDKKYGVFKINHDFKSWYLVKVAKKI